VLLKAVEALMAGHRLTLMDVERCFVELKTKLYRTINKDGNVLSGYRQKRILTCSCNPDSEDDLEPASRRR
jgi:hypothetical protein